MKLTTYLCCSVLIAFGFFCAVYAFSGWNLLLFLCLNNLIAFRCVLSLVFLSSLWLLFWLVAFRPAKPLS